MSKSSKLLFIYALIITPISIYFVANYFWLDNLNDSNLNGNGYFAPEIIEYKNATYMIRMRDGVRLATDVYLPNKTGTFPMILIRTPYGKEQLREAASNLLPIGIGLIVQDFRGCHDSEGIFDAFGSEGRDALDTINWVKNQLWFNGRIGSYGGSALSIAQYCQIPYLDDLCYQDLYVGTPNIFDHFFYQGGAPRKMLLENWLDIIDHSCYYSTILDHNLNIDPYAYARRIDDYEWSNITWPSIHTGGWYDIFSQGTIDGFMGYQYKGGFGGADNAKLVMGPWTHNTGTNISGELEYPINANYNPYIDIFIAMFGEKVLDRYDLGDYRTMPNVTYYVMGDVKNLSNDWNKWATSEVWPVPYINQTWYFHKNSSLNITPPSEFESCLKDYLFNPTIPVATRGGANLFHEYIGPCNQTPVEDGRPDILQFEYNITSPLLITGRIYGHLYISSNCTDTDFTVKLCDVYPDGTPMLIADGILRMRYRKGRDHEEFMDGSGSTVYEAYIDLWSTSYVFNAGHRIRVSISSSNYPRFDVNPNTGKNVEPLNMGDEFFYANNSLIISPDHPSSIIFPIPLNAPNFI
ncbi:MAG: CocE/NonD family hydrolase [Promethearchaeota archaeon]